MKRYLLRMLSGLVAAVVLTIGVPAAATATPTATGDAATALADTGNQLPIGWLIVGGILLLVGIVTFIISRVRNRE